VVVWLGSDNCSPNEARPSVISDAGVSYTELDAGARLLMGPVRRKACRALRRGPEQWRFAGPARGPRPLERWRWVTPGGGGSLGVCVSVTSAGAFGLGWVWPPDRQEENAMSETAPTPPADAPVPAPETPASPRRRRLLYILPFYIAAFCTFCPCLRPGRCCRRPMPPVAPSLSRWARGWPPTRQLRRPTPVAPTQPRCGRPWLTLTVGLLVDHSESISSRIRIGPHAMPELWHHKF
jgi:hypothetical protein